MKKYLGNIAVMFGLSLVVPKASKKHRILRGQGYLLALLCLSGCTGHKVASDKVFSNAQILYQMKEESPGAKKAVLAMPSYFIDIEYEPQQTKLNPAQLKKIEAIFTKLVYPEEYKMYASFGANTDASQLASLGPVFKRAQDIKARYGKRVKEIKIVYLKNQKPNCVYIRLLAK